MSCVEQHLSLPVKAYKGGTAAIQLGTLPAVLPGVCMGPTLHHHTTFSMQLTEKAIKRSYQ